MKRGGSPAAQVAAGDAGTGGGLLARMRRDPLATGVLVSVLLHGALLALRFTPPAPIKFAPFDSQIEVVLLNSQTPARPLKPEVLAQVDMQGGGDHERGRAKSPLPAEARIEDGDDVRRQTRKVAELEEQQRKLLAIARGPQTYVEPEKSPSPTNAPQPGADDDEVNKAIARLQAQIDRQISDYNKRPKRLTFGVNALGVSYARYVDDWANTIERLGTERYPPEARGKMYDSMIITVEIDKHGNVVDVIVNKKSRYEVLNRAVKQIVHAGAPYPPFSKEMAREGDILQIVRTWTFTNGTLETSAVETRPVGRK